MDYGALDICYERYADMVYRIAYLIVKQSHDAEDVVQDTFLRLMRETKPFVSEEHRKAWLIRTTQNLAKDRLRLAFYRLRTALPDDAAVCADATDAESTELRDAILRLKSKYKIPLYLHYYEGYSTAEIAKILKCKESTVRTHLKRAREMLRLELTFPDNGK